MSEMLTCRTCGATTHWELCPACRGNATDSENRNSGAGGRCEYCEGSGLVLICDADPDHEATVQSGATARPVTTPADEDDDA
jgi:hypothetical protein